MRYGVRVGLFSGLVLVLSIGAICEAPAKPRKKAGIEEKPAASGPLQLVVSLGKQQIQVYRGTELVKSSRVSTGRRGYATPAGIFNIVQKRRWHRSNLYGGAPMPFMQRLTWSGVALHAGHVTGRPASHGCIRLPAGFAKQLFRDTSIGTHVVVVRNEAKPQPITHSALLQPKPQPELVAAKAAQSENLDNYPDLSKGASSEVLPEPGQAASHRNGAESQPTPAVLEEPAEKRGEAEGDKDRGASKPEAAIASQATPVALKSGTPVEKAEQVESQSEEPAAEPAQTPEAEAGREVPPETEEAAKPEEPEEVDPLTRLLTEKSDDPLRVLLTRRTGRERIKDVQTILKELGHDPGDIDGVIGRSTSTAIRSFQEAAGLPVTGTYSDELLEALHKATNRGPVIEGHLYVRQGFKPIFDMPVALRNPSKPLGTHLFTADFKKGAESADWLVLTPEPSETDAAEALERFEIPQEVREALSVRLTPGSSMIVSDAGIGPETGRGTDFIVLTR